ncbi:DUF4267 domain-containing protein [Nocardia sp. NPDC127579]|uniref:DUF4267 domain-containing protein n=1 Tax=Nocardia sp. NPDC127579 TaxID=3345402 RepID=UPI0036392D25
MNLARIATICTLIWAAFIIYVGVGFLIAPESVAPGFGLPAWPEGEAVAFSNLKGARDITFGLAGLALLAAGQRYALGIATLVFAVAPIGDMITVLRWDGSTVTALSVHGLAAAFVALSGALLIREHRTTAAPISA